MRETCSACDETFTQDNIYSCECSYAYCYKCFAGHVESTGHKLIQAQELLWQTNPIAPSPFFSLPDSPWHKVDKAEYSGLRKAISFHLGNAASDQIEIYWCHLSFYSECRLLAFNSPLWQPAFTWLYLLEAPYPRGQVQYYALNGLSAPIFDCNKLLPICLNSDDVLNYLAFFCFFVQGEHGSFYMLTSNHDTAIPDVIWDYVASRDVTPLSARQAFVAPTIIDKDSKIYVCEATLYYGSCVYRAKLHVQSNGMVMMDSETPMTPTLPYKLEIPLSIRQ